MNGNYGVLSLVISPIGPEILYGQKWIPPEDPGASGILLAGTSTVNIKNILHSHYN